MNMLLDTSNGPITMMATGLEFEVGQDIDKMNLPGVVWRPPRAAPTRRATSALPTSASLAASTRVSPVSINPGRDAKR